jgi:hypothetical protein
MSLEFGDIARSFAGLVLARRKWSSLASGFRTICRVRSARILHGGTFPALRLCRLLPSAQIAATTRVGRKIQ